MGAVVHNCMSHSVIFIARRRSHDFKVLNASMMQLSLFCRCAVGCDILKLAVVEIPLLMPRQTDCPTTETSSGIIEV